MLKDDVKKIEWYVGEVMSHPEIVDEWSRIKKTIYEAQKTPTNSKSMPCLYNEGERFRQAGAYKYCPYCGKVL